VSQRFRQRLVRQLRSAAAIRTTSVGDAFLGVRRELFIPEVARRLGIEAVYRDEAFPTKTDARGDAISSSSQPQIMAQMLEELHPQPGHRVLEIGTGTGYNAALLRVLVGPRGRVTSIELDPDVARKARRALRSAGQSAKVVVGDGRGGWERGAPYDRIIVTASSLDVPRAFHEQLVEDGLLVVPLRLTDAFPFRQVVVAFKRAGRGFRSVAVIHGGFMRLRGRPEDASIPWPISKVVHDRDGSDSTLVSVGGSSWGRLTEEQRQRLLALLLLPHRSRSLGLRASGWRQWELETFVCLAVPEEILVGCTRADMDRLPFFGTALPGIADAVGGGVAHLGGGTAVSRVEGYGDPGAERLLANVVRRWRRRGEPGVTRLAIGVSFTGSPSKAWRTVKRGSSVLSFDYR
jgi:protein-L-isoaspartate(D-aspartate) O-methyltransferase